MAGQPIRRAYEAKIESLGGVRKILERVESGESIKSIAQDIGVSRSFLSTYLNRDPYTADALELCRALAARARLTRHPEGVGRPEVRDWLESAPRLHLEALKRFQAQLPTFADRDAPSP